MSRKINQNPREMFSLKNDDIEGSRPKRVFNKGSKKQYGYVHDNEEFWRNPWPAEHDPNYKPEFEQRNYERVDPETLLTNSKLHAYDEQKGHGKKMFPQNARTSHPALQPQQNKLDGDSLDKFQKDFMAKGFTESGTQPNKDLYPNNYHQRQQQPQYDNYHSQQQQQQQQQQQERHYQQLFEQEQQYQQQQQKEQQNSNHEQQNNNPLSQAGMEAINQNNNNYANQAGSGANNHPNDEGYQKDFEAFYRGYTPTGDSKRYKFKETLNSKEGRKSHDVDLNQDNVSIKRNVGNFYGADANVSDEELYKKNYIHFFGASRSDKFHNINAPHVQNQPSLADQVMNNQSAGPQQGKKIEYYDIITGKTQVKYVNNPSAHKRNSSMTNTGIAVTQSLDSKQFQDLRSSSKAQPTQNEQPDYRLAREKFFGISGAFEKNKGIYGAPSKLY